jgi:nuclear protein localization family protein 4
MNCIAPQCNFPDTLKVDMKVLVSTVTSPSLLEDPSALNALFKTESWQTLMTFTRESARKCHYRSLDAVSYVHISLASLPSTSGPGASSSHIDDDIPQDVFDQIAAEEAARREGAGRVSSGIKICPHCTFENSEGETDCEVCGLPLG